MNSMNSRYPKKAPSMKNTLKTKLTVIAVSLCLGVFNSHSMYAMETTDTMTTTDSTTDTSTDTNATTDTTNSGTTGTETTADGSVVDLLENTDSEQPPAEESSDGGGGSSSGGAILGVVAIAAIVAVVLSTNKKKKPQIQKTLVSDKIANQGTEFIELSGTSDFIDQNWQKGVPQLSLQYGSYEQALNNGLPYSFINARLTKSVGTSFNLYADVGTRLFYNGNAAYGENDFGSAQWLSFSLQTKDVISTNDRIEFLAKYTVGDKFQRHQSLLLDGSSLQNYTGIFSNENTQFELAYSRALGQNQRLKLQLQKVNSLDAVNDSDYQAVMAWRHAF